MPMLHIRFRYFVLQGHLHSSNGHGWHQAPYPNRFGSLWWADSMALCTLTAGWKSDGLAKRDDVPGWVDGLVGIVVDHKLRPESSVEANMVQNRVHKMGVRCEILCCDWPDGQPKLGHLQEAARDMRYQLLVDICMKQQISILLIGHHADDQAELLVLSCLVIVESWALQGWPLFHKCFHNMCLQIKEYYLFIVQCLNFQKAISIKFVKEAI